MKLSGYLIVVFFLVGLVTNCSKSETTVEAGNVKNQNILRYDVSAPFVSLNPEIVDATGSMHIFPLLFSYLFIPDENGILQPDLATHWEYDTSSYKWVIHLRKEVVFHNKQPLSSKDVKYSLEKLLPLIQPSSNASVREIYLPTEDSVCIVLKKDDPEFLKKIWDLEIFPRPGGHKADTDHPIGTGPFKFKYKKGQNRVFLSANEHYFWGRPLLDGIIFYYQPDKEKSWTRLISGQTDIAQEISPKNYQMIRKYENRFYFDQYVMKFYSILLYNTHDILFSDPDVRMALSHAINKEYIVDNILNGYGKVAAGPMGIDSFYHNPEVLPIAYNPGKALYLLQQAGWHYDNKAHCLKKNDRRFEFSILVFKEYQIEKKVAQYIKLCFNDIGIRVKIQAMPYNELVRRYRRNTEFQAVLTEFTGAYRCPEFVNDLWAFNIDNGCGAGGFKNRDVTLLLNKAADEQNPLKKKALMFKVDKLINDLQPGTFLYHKTAIDVMSRRFALPGPFSLTCEGLCRLRLTELKNK